MFNHKQLVKEINLESYAKLYNHCNVDDDYIIYDYLDIVWYQDVDWAQTFEDMLKELEKKGRVKFYTTHYLYKIKVEENSFIVSKKSLKGGKNNKYFKNGIIPVDSENSLFIYVTTATRGDFCDIAIDEREDDIDNKVENIKELMKKYMIYDNRDFERAVEFVEELLYIEQKHTEEYYPKATKSIQNLKDTARIVYDLKDLLDEMEEVI